MSCQNKGRDRVRKQGLSNELNINLRFVPEVFHFRSKKGKVEQMKRFVSFVQVVFT